MIETPIPPLRIFTLARPLSQTCVTGAAFAFMPGGLLGGGRAALRPPFLPEPSPPRRFGGVSDKVDTSDGATGSPVVDKQHLVMRAIPARPGMAPTHRSVSLLGDIRGETSRAANGSPGALLGSVPGDTFP